MRLERERETKIGNLIKEIERERERGTCIYLTILLLSYKAPTLQSECTCKREAKSINSIFGFWEKKEEKRWKEKDQRENMVTDEASPWNVGN